MNTTNLPPAPFEVATNTVVGRIYHYFAHQESSTWTHLLLIVVVAILAHVLVKIMRYVSEWLLCKSQAKRNRKNCSPHRRGE